MNLPLLPLTLLTTLPAPAAPATPSRFGVTQILSNLTTSSKDLKEVHDSEVEQLKKVERCHLQTLLLFCCLTPTHFHFYPCYSYYLYYPCYLYCPDNPYQVASRSLPGADKGEILAEKAGRDSRRSSRSTGSRRSRCSNGGSSSRGSGDR